MTGAARRDDQNRVLIQQRIQDYRRWLAQRDSERLYCDNCARQVKPDLCEFPPYCSSKCQREAK